jgi:hypothetical protein
MGAEVLADPLAQEAGQLGLVLRKCFYGKYLRVMLERDTPRFATEFS